MEKKEIYTTYEVSKICRVDLSTVIEWVDAGKLKAYRTPGGHRRVKFSDIVEFLKKYNLPFPAGWSESAKLLVLIVDDEEGICKVLTKILREILGDVRIDIASDGFEAGSKVVSLIPDLVILDLRLPGLDGFRVCEFIRKEITLKHTKILAITGFDSPEIKEKILRLGANDYLRKPFDYEEVKEKILKLLKRG